MSVLSVDPRGIHDACKEAVVDSLLNNLSARLAGRGEFYKIIVGGKPSSVLMSEFIVPMPPDERDGDEEANPIQISAHGLDFQIARSSSKQNISVAVRGAVYVRILPEANDLKPGAHLEPRFPLTRDARRQLKMRVKEDLAKVRTELGMTGRGAKAHPDWPSKSSEVRRKAHEDLGIPFDNQLDRTKVDADGDDGNESVAANDGDGDSEAPPPSETKMADGLPDALAEAIAPPPKWLPLEVQLPTLRFTPETAERDAAATSTGLNEAASDGLRNGAGSSTEPYGGKLWGFRHGRPIKPSDVRNWDRYLESVRDSKVAALVPSIDLRWDLRALQDPLDPQRLTLHVALENWSAPTTAQNRREVEPSLFQTAVSVTLPASAHRQLKLDRVKPSYRYNQYLQYPAIGFNGGVVSHEANDLVTLTTTWSPRYVLPRLVPTDRSSEGVCSEIL